MRAYSRQFLDLTLMLNPEKCPKKERIRKASALAEGPGRRLPGEQSVGEQGELAKRGGGRMWLVTKDVLVCIYLVGYRTAAFLKCPSCRV